MKYAIKSGSGVQLPNGVMLQAIIARVDFTTVDGVEVHAGDEGGLIQGEHNLSQEGTCWVHKGARVYGKAKVLESAVVCSDVELNGRTIIKGNTVMAPSVGVRVVETDLSTLRPLAPPSAAQAASHLTDLPL